MLAEAGVVARCCRAVALAAGFVTSGNGEFNPWLVYQPVAVGAAQRAVCVRAWLRRWIPPVELCRSSVGMLQSRLFVPMLVPGTSCFWVSEAGWIPSPAPSLPLQTSFLILDFLYLWRRGEE